MGHSPTGGACNPILLLPTPKPGQTPPPNEAIVVRERSVPSMLCRESDERTYGSCAVSPSRRLLQTGAVRACGRMEVSASNCPGATALAIQPADDEKLPDANYAL